MITCMCGVSVPREEWSTHSISPHDWDAMIPSADELYMEVRSEAQ